MDLDLEKESHPHLSQNLFQEEKEDGPGGSEVIIETPDDLRIRSKIEEFMLDWTRVVMQ